MEHNIRKGLRVVFVGDGGMSGDAVSCETWGRWRGENWRCPFGGCRALAPSSCQKLSLLVELGARMAAVICVSFRLLQQYSYSVNSNTI